MGLVYEAEQTEPIRRRVALKVLKVGLDTAAFIGRFEAERQALAVMDHPNIARVFDAGATPAGRPFYTMEYVPGLPLTQYADEQQLDIRGRIELFIDVCAAVQHAHLKGIIHRDLKPSNLLVTLRENRPEPKVIDFGIAKALTGRLVDRTFATELGHPIGTPAYMSPEQWDAGALDLDTRTDIYSLGVVLYELLVGILPHDPSSLARAGPVGAPVLLRDTAPPTPSTRFQGLGGQGLVLAKIRKTDPGSLTRTLRGDLDWITLKAMEGDRTRRYETVHELATDLRRYLRSEPVQAHPPTVTYRVGRLIRRHRVGTAVVGVLVLAAAGFVGMMLVQSRRVARERDAAMVAAARADALNDFLQRTLLSPDPMDGLGRDATMLQTLDVAVRHLAEHRLPQPEADGAVRSAIGWAYFKLGSYDRAGPLLGTALARRREFPGTDSRDLAESLLRFASWHDVLGRPDSARPLYLEALAIRRHRGEANSAPLAELLIRSGAFFRSQGDTAEARSALEEALGIYRHVGDSLGVATAQSNLGTLEYDGGNLRGAEQAFREALDLRRAQLREHPLLAEALVNYGLVLDDLYRYAEAEAAYREGLRMAEGTLGPDHDQVTAIYNNLALLLGKVGRVAEARPLFQKALAADERKLGRNNPAVGIDLFNLAEMECRLGDPVAGAAAGRRSMEIFSRSPGLATWQAANARIVVGRCLTRDRQFSEAERYLLQGKRELEQALGPAHRRVDSAKARLAELYQAWKPRR